MFAGSSGGGSVVAKDDIRVGGSNDESGWKSKWAGFHAETVVEIFKRAGSVWVFGWGRCMDRGEPRGC